MAFFSSRGRALRPFTAKVRETVVASPSEDVPLHRRWYIESKPAAGPVHSCSFVEFDERGDYLDFPQHRQAYLKVQELAASGEPLTLVIYVHGWRHNGQSHDVLAFNELLHQLANRPAGSEPRRRVHGVYLAWRGAAFASPVPDSEARARVQDYFGGSLIDPACAATVGWLNAALETLGYFNRKSVPEFKFAGTSLSRTLFSCAYAARRNADKPQVMLIGHSFGALLLERAFQNAAIGQLTDKWPFGNEQAAVAEANPLPFDSVILVNSAAPSIYAKQFQSYLAAHRQAMVMAGSKHADTPFMFSVTSEGDWATGIAHSVANSLSFLVPSLWRNYLGNDFILAEGGPQDTMKVPQSYYYRRTPGHNPLLVNRFIEPAQRTTALADTPFTTTTDDDKQLEWMIAFPPTTEPYMAFSTYRGYRPLAWTKRGGKLPFKDTAYWIIRCPKAIMNGHNDIWSQAAMDMYAELHRIALPAKG